MQLAAIFRAALISVAIVVPLASIASAPQRVTRDAAPCQGDAKWIEPASTMHIYGDTWFVGTCGLSSILITSPPGHILIDGDVEEAAGLIEANIRELGFRVEGVRYILNSHEHFDYAGGIAQVQRDTRAVVMARAPAAATFSRGRGDRGDPQFMSIPSYTAKANVRIVPDGLKIRIEPLEITAHAAPGHAPGGTTWTWKSCEKSRCLDIVYADSLSAISDHAFRYTDDAKHASYLAALRHSSAAIAGLRCDVLTTPHRDASDLRNHVGVHPIAPLVDRAACRRYAETASANLAAHVQRESTGSQP